MRCSFDYYKLCELQVKDFYAESLLNMFFYDIGGKQANVSSASKRLPPMDTLIPEAS